MWIPQAKDLYDRQHAWLAAEMASSRAQGATHVLLFAHHPLFLVRDDEDESTEYVIHRALQYNTRDRPGSYDVAFVAEHEEAC